MFVLVEDSNFRTYLKENGYGFVARVTLVLVGKEPMRRLLPMNRGVDMSPAQMQAAYDAAVGAGTCPPSEPSAGVDDVLTCAFDGAEA